MDNKKKERQMKYKADRTKVRLKGEIVEKRRLELGITSQEEAAELMKLNIRTYHRAIRGEPTSLKTAKKICEPLDLKLKKVLIIELKNELPLANVLKQFPEDSDPISEAFVQANDAIENNLARLGIWRLEEIQVVFALLLTRFGSAIARHSEDLEVGYEFVDTAALLAKTQIPKFFKSKETDSDESD